MMPPFVVFPTNRIAHFVEVSLYLFYLAQRVKLLDYVYARGGEPTIPSRKGAKFERHCDWWLYKERHLVEKYFLKLKAFRRIATRYDKLAATYLGFICIASILIWLK